MEIIFGRDFKLEAADPYLFYAYEFRRYCLLSKLIVSIGYSFGDAHINKMIAQGIRADPERLLMVVTRCEKKDFQKKKYDISKRSKWRRARSFLRRARLKSSLRIMN